MPFRKYSNQFRKGVCQLTCDCGHSPSKTAEESTIHVFHIGSVFESYIEEL